MPLAGRSIGCGGRRRRRDGLRDDRAEQHGGDRVVQGGRLDRLGQPARDASLFPVAHANGGEDDNRRRDGRPVGLAQPRGEVEPVHLRHQQVREHDVESLTAGDPIERL